MKTILGSQQLFPLCPNAGQRPFQPITNHPSHESAASLHYPSHESTASLHSEPCCTIVRQTTSMMTWPTRPHSYREPWIIEDTIFVNGHGTWQCHPTQKSTAPNIRPFPSFMESVTWVPRTGVYDHGKGYDYRCSHSCRTLEACWGMTVWISVQSGASSQISMAN